jgi:hypothetical protein
VRSGWPAPPMVLDMSTAIEPTYGVDTLPLLDPHPCIDASPGRDPSARRKAVAVLMAARLDCTSDALIHSPGMR